jgi:DNA-binding NarL/FixJ family response regulator
VTLRVLLAEAEPETILYLREVLTELDGARHWSSWTHVETAYAATCADAAAILAAETMDIVLLDPDLPDCRDADAFRQIQAAAPHIPVILLVDLAAAPLAERLVREGAQDFLLTHEIDCAPLAHAIRNARERHRLLAAARATAMTDGLTGLLTRAAFLTLAGRDVLLAERLRRRMLILVAEVAGLDGRSQRGDLALVDAADRLRSLAGPAALVARLGPSRLGAAVLDTEAQSIEDIRSRLSDAGAQIAWGAAHFDPQHPESLDHLLDLAVLNLGSKAAHAGA